MDTRDETPDSPVLGRRALIRTAGALGIASLIGRRADAAALAPACVLTPAGPPGPYYLPLGLQRRKLIEDQRGSPVMLVLRIVRASDCSPIPGALVDVWHANAAGDYSGIAALGTASETWLRGFQIADASGTVAFETIYPGWYPGRTTHFHVHVYVAPNLFTTQLYLPDSLSNEIYEQGVYALRGPKQVKNADDIVYIPETVMSVQPTYPSFSPFRRRRVQRLAVGMTIALA